jgi:hypothetical protein
MTLNTRLSLLYDISKKTALKYWKESAKDDLIICDTFYSMKAGGWCVIIQRKKTVADLIESANGDGGPVSAFVSVGGM